MKVTDEEVEAAAMADAEFDGRAWLAMPRSDRDRYLQRSRGSLQAAERVREAAGLVIVPREPTPEMMEAGGDFETPACDYNVSIGSESARDAWRAMVKAASAVGSEKIS